MISTWYENRKLMVYPNGYSGTVNSNVAVGVEKQASINVNLEVELFVVNQLAPIWHSIGPYLYLYIQYLFVYIFWSMLMCLVFRKHRLPTWIDVEGWFRFDVSCQSREQRVPYWRLLYLWCQVFWGWTCCFRNSWMF